MHPSSRLGSLFTPSFSCTGAGRSTKTRKVQIHGTEMQGWAPTTWLLGFTMEPTPATFWDDAGFCDGCMDTFTLEKTFHTPLESGPGRKIIWVIQTFVELTCYQFVGFCRGDGAKLRANKEIHGRDILYHLMPNWSDRYSMLQCQKPSWKAVIVAL